jgi:hypothetical protein
MATKFGSDTGAFGSGTEEEFEIALAKNSVSKKPEIQFYFSEAKYQLSQVNFEQYTKVQNFRKSIGGKGVYYRGFQDTTHFRALVRNALYEVVIRIFRDSESSTSSASTRESPRSLLERQGLNNLANLISTDAEAALNFFAYRATFDMELFTYYLKNAGKRTAKLTRDMANIASRISSSDLGNPKRAKVALKQLEALFSQLEKLNDWFTDEIPRAEKNFRSSVSNFQRAALLVPEGNIDEREALDAAVVALEALRASMNELSSTSLAVGTQLSLQKEGGARFVSNSKVFAALLRDFSDFLNRADASVGEVLSSARQQVA